MINKGVKSVVAKLLAQENIRVTHRNVPTACFYLETRELVLPIWDSMSAEVYDKFVGHEVGHALWTPPAAYLAIANKTAQMSDILNVVEDIRIDVKIMNRYPGLRKTYAKAWNTLHEQGFYGDAKQVNTYNFVDRINTHCKGGAFLNIKFNDKEQEILNRAIKVATWEDTVRVSNEILEYIKSTLTPVVPKAPKLDMPKLNLIDALEQLANAAIDAEEMPEDFDNEQMSMGKESDPETEDGELVASEAGEIMANVEPEKDAFGDEYSARSEDETAGDDIDSEEGNSDVPPLEAPVTPDNDEIDGSVAVDPSLDAATTSHTLNSENAKLIQVYGNQKYDYTNVQINTTNTGDLSKRIYGYKSILKDLAEHDTNARSWAVPQLENVKERLYSDHNKANKDVVNHMVREFEMKKRAQEYMRNTTSKTGVIDCGKLHSYKYNDDIFARMDSTPSGKNHGLIMYVDWSGSMSNKIADVLTQTINLVSFARQVNIPFRVYAFTDSELLMLNMSDNKLKLEVGDFDVNKMAYLELFSSKMKKSEVTLMAKHLILAVTQDHTDYDVRTAARSMGLPQHLKLSSTPLIAAISGSFNLYGHFKRKEKCDIVTTIWLTDGEDSGYGIVDENGKSSSVSAMFNTEIEKMNAERVKKTLNIYNPISKKNMSITDNYFNSDYICKMLLELYEDYTQGNVIGYYVIENKKLKYALPYFERSGSYEDVQARVKAIRKAGFVKYTSESGHSSGYTEKYFILETKFKSETGHLDDIDGKATVRKIGTAFAKDIKKKKESRVLVSQIMELVA